jgi:hypothetical protein
MMRTLPWILCGLIGLMAVGCGSVNSAADASVPDDAPPGTDGPPATGEATIEVQLLGELAAGLAVVFHDSDGAITAEELTNSTGTASSTIGRDSMITVAAAPDHLLTLFAIQPGDQIVVTTLPDGDGESIDNDIQVTSNQEAPNVSFYTVEAGQRSFQTGQSLTAGITTSTTSHALNESNEFHVLAVAYDANDEITSYSFVNDLSLDPGDTTAVSVPTPFRTDISTLTVSVNGVPGGDGSMLVESSNHFDGSMWAQSELGGTDQATITNGSASIAVPYLGSFGDGVEVLASVSLDSGRFLWARRVPLSTSTIDLGPDDMPPQLSATFDSSEAGRPAVSWSADGDVSSGDTVFVSLSWRDADQGTFHWSGFLPPEATEARVPVLPGSLSGQVPAGGSVFSAVTVHHVDLGSADGYSAFRQRPVLDSSLAIGVDPDFRPLPQGESVVMSEVSVSL